MENLLQVGAITSIHGIRGEVKVFPTTDDVNRFKKLKEVILPPLTQYIDVKAFAQCTSLETIQIPNTTYYIDSTAFDGFRTPSMILSVFIHSI